VSPSSRREILTLDEIAKYNTNDPADCIRLANYYNSKRQYAEAANYFNKAILLVPDDLSVYKSCSEAYLKAGQVDDAILVMERARAIAADDYDVIITLAPLYSIAGRRDEVIELYKEGIKANREKRAHLRVRLAEFFEKNDRYAEAAEQYETIAAENQDLAHFREKAESMRNKETANNHTTLELLKLKRADKNTKHPRDFDPYVPDKFRVMKNETGNKGESIYEIASPRLKVACLMYRAYGSDLKDELDPDNEHFQDTYLRIAVHDFVKETPDIYARYGYTINKNMLGDLVISSIGQNLKRSTHVLYPEELEPDMHTFLVKCLFENGCNVIDMTNCKTQYDATRLADVITYYRNTYQVDAIFIFHYQLYSSYLELDPLNKVEGREYGLMCDFRAMLIDSRNMEVLFQDGGSTRAFVMSGGKSAFFGGSGPLVAKVEWLGKKEFTGGIMDREWLKKSFLATFKRYDTMYVENVRSKRQVPFSLSIASSLKYDFESVIE